LPTSESIWAFGGVQVPREEARAVLIPVAYDLTTTYGTGARNGPRALLEASTHMELFDEELGFAPTDVGVHTSEIVEQIASGPEGMVLAVSELVGQVLDEGRFPILVGGDHSLSIGSFIAMQERKLPVTVLHLDAHADLREEYQGTPYSHACVMARGREWFPCVSIGIRSLSEPEWIKVQHDRLAIFPARRIREDPEEFLAEVGPLVARSVYLTLDLDVLDPSILPSTGTPEPGGLTWEEILWLVRSLVRTKEVVGFDIMELSPIPGLRAPDFLAAKLLNKILGYTCPPGAVATDRSHRRG
jgi:agmatinase